MNEMVERVGHAIWVEAAKMAGGVLDYAEIGRAAITAMRDPTDAMWTAGTNAGDTGCLTTDIWQAMINAALADDPAPAEFDADATRALR